jgi:cyclase
MQEAAIIATAKCREALAPGFPPVPILQRFMPDFAGEFPLLKVCLPTVTFADRLVLHDGDREIHLWHPGFAAHTVGDAAVFLPKERVLFSGDIAFHYVTPLAFQGHVGNWIKAADRLLTYEADVIMPGPGPIGTKKDLKAMRDYLALIRREARKRLDGACRRRTPPRTSSSVSTPRGARPSGSCPTSCAATRSSATRRTRRWTSSG